jgi:hypothetical protein
MRLQLSIASSGVQTQAYSTQWSHCRCSAEGCEHTCQQICTRMHATTRMQRKQGPAHMQRHSSALVCPASTRPRKSDTCMLQSALHLQTALGACVPMHTAWGLWLRCSPGCRCLLGCHHGTPQSRLLHQSQTTAGWARQQLEPEWWSQSAMIRACRRCMTTFRTHRCTLFGTPEQSKASEQLLASFLQVSFACMCPVMQNTCMLDCPSCKPYGSAM